MPNEYYETGETAKIRVQTTDTFTKALADPATLVIEVKFEDAPTTIYTYGTSSEIARTTGGAVAGDFTFALPLPTAGIYKGTIVDTVAGTGGKVAEQTFSIVALPKST